MDDKNEIILYQPNEEIKLEVRLDNETVWLTQAQMAELFGVQRQAITKHLKNIFDSGELDKGSTSSILELLQKEGGRMVNRQVELYNLDVIISVGFRVNTKRGIQFRQWANKVLKEYLLRGYSINQRFERLEQRVAETENKIDFFVRTSLPPVEGIFYNGQIFEAYKFVNDLIRSAKHQITLIDNYIDDSVLAMLDKRAENVRTQIYTQEINSKLQTDIDKHNSQYKEIEVTVFKNCHDRFLIIDNDVYHIGASIKDLGKRWFAFCKMGISANEILNKLK
ncbi:MAG: virulence RhuM family protein [Bacteroidales bacterium]|nr:virulence RhuM family protein [Bacteroidales bacterium]